MERTFFFLGFCPPKNLGGGGGERGKEMLKKHRYYLANPNYVPGSGARGGLKLSRTLDESPRHRLVSLGNPKKKKCSLLFWFSRGQIFLKWKGHFSFWGSALQVFGQCGGTMRTKFWQNYFLGKGFAKTSAHLFLNSDVANGKGGVWGGIFHLLLFLFLKNWGRT